MKKLGEQLSHVSVDAPQQEKYLTRHRTPKKHVELMNKLLVLIFDFLVLHKIIHYGSGYARVKTKT